MSRVRGAVPLLAATVLLSAASAASPSASRAEPALAVQPQLGVPGLKTLIGASPGQAPGEVWGTGEIGPVPAMVGGQPVVGQVLLRHAQGTGWQIVPVAPFTGKPQVTFGGGVAMLSANSTTIVAHDPNGASVTAPAPAQAPAAGAVLEGGERLSEDFATIDEESGHTGALIVPAGLSSSTPGVLHYDGAEGASPWTREPICESAPAPPEPCTVPTELGSVKAIAASSPHEAWLLATGSRSDEPVLFKRTEVGAPGSGSFAWVQVQVSWAPASEGEVLTLKTPGQMLTVTPGGVWVDADLENDGQLADLSLLVRPLQLGKFGQWSSEVPGRWCYPDVSPACTGSLGAPLPERFSSFAWGGSGLGSRIIAGLQGGAFLQFQGSGDFHYTFGGGGLATPNAAFAKSGEGPAEGWVAGASGGAGEAGVERVTAAPETPLLGAGNAWPLPFRRPLLAIAPQPGVSPGEGGAEALAVGDGGQIARYLPGRGWTPEFLYSGSGAVQTPLLRGVAWPEPGRAYAVGDEGAMWLWRADTGLWEPDPAAPLGLHADLTAIAFSPSDPSVGYAVGKQGALLAYDKTWTQQALPAGLEQADFTSVAFAGGEALATYRMVPPEPLKVCPQGHSAFCEIGGLIVNKGEGWEIDPSAQQLLGSLPSPTATVLSKVAGLPGGGAVAAGPGIVIERDSAGSPWRFSHQPLPEAQNISALAAMEAGGEVRALVSIDLAPENNPNNGGLFEQIDPLPPPGFNQPFTLVGADPPPYTGYLLRETGEGWQDLEQQAYPREMQSLTASDLPNWPDPVLALDVNATGSQGWAVGGQTGKSTLLPAGSQETAIETSAALRLGPGAPPPQGQVAIAKPEGQATFAVGGDAQCLEPCSALAPEGLGPDAWLSGAISTAARIPGLRAFLYTGARVAGTHGGAGSTWELGGEQFSREMRLYADDLSHGGGLTVRVAPTSADHDPEGGLATFASALGADAGEGSSQLPGTGAYVFDSAGSGGTVRVIVLDDSPSAFALGELGWLEGELVAAKAAALPAIVMGATDVAHSGAPSLAALERVLANSQHGASAYFYDTPNENSATRIGSGANAVPAFGTGTLGYVPPASQPEDFLGASGFLLASVNVAGRNRNSNRAPVTATLTPNIAQLALDATDGTLLRRSQVALFQAIARRPFGGSGRVDEQLAPDPYVPIPETCIGSNCGQFIEPEYTFTSSRPDIGTFVEPQPSSKDPHEVLQGAGGKPIPEAHSGLFCAFNAGTTTVSIATGGLSYSEQITVQPGSVQQPCGTVPLKNPPAATARTSAPVAPLPPSAPPASSPTPLLLAPPPPPPAVPATPAAPPPPRATPAPPPFFVKPVPPVALIAVPLLPPPVLARPIPPSGTSPVTAPGVAPQEEQEDEEAVESARNSMAAYHPEDPTLPGVSVIALIVIAAGAGVGIRRTGRSRRVGRTPSPAWARTKRYERI